MSNNIRVLCPGLIEFKPQKININKLYLRLCEITKGSDPRYSDEFHNSYQSTYDYDFKSKDLLALIHNCLNDEGLKFFLKSNYPKHNFLTETIYRIVYKSNGYLEWHRDRSFNGAHGLKLFYYPSFNNQNHDVLYISGKPKINVPHLKNRISSYFYKLIYLVEIMFSGKKTLKSNNECFYIIDTSLIHKPALVKDSQMAPRLMSFIATEKQLERFQNKFSYELN